MTQSQRKNSGGSSVPGDWLLKYLTAKSFRQFDEEWVKVSVKAQKEKPDQPEYRSGTIGSIVQHTCKFVDPGLNPLRFEGKVFVLIGPLTSSSAVDFAAAVKAYDIGTLIGKETSQKMVSYGESVIFRLPNSDLKLFVASKRFVRTGAKDDGRGLIPHHHVKQKPEDTAKSVDTVLEFTLDLIKKRDNEESNKN